MQRLLSELRKRKRNQKGFTLIEMLVVISILGILAAIVTMSMVGVANLAQSRANEAEMKTVQVALDTMAIDTMASDNGVAQGAVCPGGGAGTSQGTATNDLSDFPHNGAVKLFPKYIRIQTTQQQSYWCDTDGTVHGTATQ
jgi:prepilin-type N-terminal cleavage/methylation domain-containing protein